MEFKNTVVSNFEGAFRGLRNPLESWNKSDSIFGIENVEYCQADWDVAAEYCRKENVSPDDGDRYYQLEEKYADWLVKNGILHFSDDSDLFEYAFIGPNDLDLAHRMIKAGSSDSKFLRQINVSVDITAPLYFFKEFDTYKVGTVANSTSTMHKLASTPITLDCFETDDYKKSLLLSEESTEEGIFGYFVEDMVKDLINHLETLRLKYLETKDKKYWKELIRWLPSGWLQTRTVTMNYAVLRNQYFQRQHHKLSEWRQYCKWIESLPYADDLIIYTGNE